MTPNYLKQSYFFLKANLSTLVSIQLPFILVLIFLKQSLISDIEEGSNLQRELFMLTGLDLLFVPIYLAATILFMQSVVEKKPISALQALLNGLSVWGRLFLTFLFSAIAISLGLMLLVVPGIYIGVRLALANMICVLDGKGPAAAMRSSWTFSEPHFWMLFKGLATIYGAIFAAELLIAPLVGTNSLVAMLCQAVLDFLNIFGTIFAFRIYCAWRDGELKTEET